MRSRDAIDAPEALVLTMVLVSAADGGMTDREIGVMSALVQTLPAFEDFTREALADVTERAAELLHDDDGLAHAARLMRAALTPNCAKPPTRWPARSWPAARGKTAVAGHARFCAWRTGAGPIGLRRNRTRRARPLSTC